MPASHANAGHALPAESSPSLSKEDFKVKVQAIPNGMVLMKQSGKNTGKHICVTEAHMLFQ